jgi:MFS family permease
VAEPTAAPERAPETPARRRFGAGFWPLWTATTASGLGDGSRIAAFALLAASITRDPLQVSLVTVAARLPWVCVGPITGALGDRLDRGRTLVVCDVLRAVLMASFAVLVVTRHAGIVLLAFAAFLLSSFATMAENLSQAVVPEVVGGRTMESANSWLMGGQFVTTDFFGNPLGTTLFVLDRALPFFVDALSFAASGLLVARTRAVLGRPGARMPGPAAPGPRPGLATTAREVLAETAEGIRWLRRHRVLRTVCVLIGLLNFSVLAVIGTAVLYALEILGVTRAEYGLLLVVISVGGLIGLILAPKIVPLLGSGRTLQLCFALCPLPLLVGGLTSDAVLAAALLGLVGASITLATVVTTTLRQTLVPKGLFGKVNGAYRLVVNGLSPLGGVVGGLIAAHLGLRAPFFLSAGLMLLATLVSLPLLSNRAIEAAARPNAS